VSSSTGNTVHRRAPSTNQAAEGSGCEVIAQPRSW
jgi:hypothetical protein